MTAATVALSLKTGTMTETSEATETDSVVRMAPAAIRAFYDLHGRKPSVNLSRCRLSALQGE